MKKKKLTNQQLEREMFLLTSGWYDDEVKEFVSKYQLDLLKKTGHNTIACYHGLPICNICCRKWWFKTKFKGRI
jgi:hypothetical protein